jgi:hypothetical protein
MSGSNKDYSGNWAGGDGDIDDITQYMGSPGGALTMVLSFDWDEGIAGAILQDGLPFSDAIGLVTVYAKLEDGVAHIYAEIVGPDAPPVGDIGPTSQLVFGPPISDEDLTSYSWLVTPSDAPSPPPEEGMLVDDDNDVVDPPEYTVSGSDSVASISTSSGDAVVPGHITFTGMLTAAEFTPAR